MFPDRFAGVIAESNRRIVLVPRGVSGVNCKTVPTVSSICSLKDEAWHFVSAKGTYRVVEDISDGAIRGSLIAVRIKCGGALQRSQTRSSLRNKSDVFNGITGDDSVQEPMRKRFSEACHQIKTGPIQAVFNGREAVLYNPPLRSQCSCIPGIVNVSERDLIGCAEVSVDAE